MKNIAIIPARKNSKGVPGKNKRLLNGLPLVCHSIIFAKDDPNIELVSYKDLYDSKELRVIYLSWLNDLSITKLIASEALNNNNKTESF